jgi:hypothetical protein
MWGNWAQNQKTQTTLKTSVKVIRASELTNLISGTITWYGFPGNMLRIT